LPTNILVCQFANLIFQNDDTENKLLAAQKTLDLLSDLWLRRQDSVDHFSTIM
jgi:hypothetical protein